MTWKQYRRKSISEMRPYVEGEDLSHVSISQPDKDAGSPKVGDMIARNPKNHGDQWLVAKAYFEDNLEPLEEDWSNFDWMGPDDVSTCVNWDSLKPIGLNCSECGEPQFETPSGACCKNGHGGADGVPNVSDV